MHHPKFIATTFGLDWSANDLAKHPWLNRNPRFYSLGSQLGEGAFGRVFCGYPLVGSNPEESFPDAPKIVVKLPKIDLEGYPRNENLERLDYVRNKNLTEFVHIRKRLKDTVHANPIIDLASLHDSNLGLELPVTIQLHLENSLNLDQWLVLRQFRPQLAPHVEGKAPAQWHGVTSRIAWLNISLAIAIAARGHPPPSGAARRHPPRQHLP